MQRHALSYVELDGAGPIGPRTPLHILFRVAGYDNIVIEAIPKDLHPLDARQWNRVETLANTRTRLICRETKSYDEFKNKEKELIALDADMEATTGVHFTVQEKGIVAVEGTKGHSQTEDASKTWQNVKRKLPMSSASPDSPLPFLAYPKAFKILADRLAATQDEIAAWVWAGPKNGGLAAYLNANELDPPPRFYYGTGNGQNFDYLAPLMACWFYTDDIANFKPSDRYITGKALIERWEEEPFIQAEAFIRAKIAESRLLDAHPIFGGTQGTFPDEEHFPPLENGLFVLSHVEKIEAEDFPSELAESAEKSVGDSSVNNHTDLAGSKQEPTSTMEENTALPEAELSNPNGTELSPSA